MDAKTVADDRKCCGLKGKRIRVVQQPSLSVLFSKFGAAYEIEH